MSLSLVRECPGCGEEFVASHGRHLYCSEECGKLARGRTATCEQCGVEFKAVQEYGTFKWRYCSPGCRGKAAQERAVAKYPPKDEIERLYCEEGLSDKELGRQFGHSYQWSLGVRRYYGIPGRRDVGFHTRSKPLHKKSDRTRWHISLKREPVCRSCGRPDGGSGGVLQLHHILPRSMSKAAKYDLRNGLPLCVACHMGWHRRSLTIYRDALTADEWAFVSAVSMQGFNLGAWLDGRYPNRQRPFRDLAKSVVDVSDFAPHPASLPDVPRGRERP